MFKTKLYVRAGMYDHNLVELKKVGMNKKTFATKIPVERDAIGRIVLYDKDGKSIGRKPKDVVEIEGKKYFDD